MKFYVGDPVPDFTARSSNNPRFRFNAAAGRYLVLSFIGSSTAEGYKAAHDHIITTHRGFFNDDRASFFAITVDAHDEQKLQQQPPGIRYFWDFDQVISRLYGAINEDTPANSTELNYHGFTLVLDPMQRVLGMISMENVAAHNATIDRILPQLPPVKDHAGTSVHAPVLILPRVLEPDFCKHLIAQHETNGGTDSGFMREKDGKTITVLDHQFKRRSDFAFDEPPEFEPLRASIRSRMIRRLLPEIQKSFQYKVTRIERYLVACYDGDSGGHFRPHRDNTTPGTAHRRFACTFNLNAEDYDGGELRFPEFGPATYRAPTGGAVVFSCSLLHEATPVTRGKRYALLPFLYDDEAAQIRRENMDTIDDNIINRNIASS